MTARIRLRMSGAIRSVDPLLEWQVVFGTDSRAIFLKGKRLVDVTGLEPAALCLQSRLGKTLNAFAGVAYTENQRNSRSPNVPKLYRSAATGVSLSRKGNEVSAPENVPKLYRISVKKPLRTPFQAVRVFDHTRSPLISSKPVWGQLPHSRPFAQYSLEPEFCLRQLKSNQ